jgi:RNA polymerase sigma-70 factor, ECF subfamily
MVSAVAAYPVPERSESERLRAALVMEIAGGSEDALAQLYDHASPVVYGLALRLLREPSSAEDVTLDVFLQVWRNAESYDVQRGPVLAWLVTMVRSRAIDRLRSRQGRAATVEQPLEESAELHDRHPNPERASIDSGKSRLINSALAELSPEQREVIELVYFSGFSHTEVASRSGLPLGTVKTRVRQGMLRLRKLLAPYAEGL